MPRADVGLKPSAAARQKDDRADYRKFVPEAFENRALSVSLSLSLPLSLSLLHLLLLSLFVSVYSFVSLALFTRGV